MVGHRDVEELVGGDVETTPLQLVEQAEAGAADVGGIAPAHLVGAVDAAAAPTPAAIASYVGAASAPTARLSRSSGTSAPANVAIEASVDDAGNRDAEQAAGRRLPGLAGSSTATTPATVQATAPTARVVVPHAHSVR